MNEKYVRQIVKRLKCSRKQREEIRRQLAADLAAEAESGVSEGELAERMGNPREIAEEFNQNFSEAEIKRYRKEKWQKRLAVLGAVIVVLAVLVYWAWPKSRDLADSKVFDEEEVRERAQQTVQLLDAGDYDALREESTDKLQTVFTGQQMEEAKQSLSPDWGEFQAFGNSYMVELTQMGKRSAVVQLNASYEKISVTYTLSFDEDMKLAGLWMK